MFAKIKKGMKGVHAMEREMEQRMKIGNFLSTYRWVFDKERNIKSCGRDITKRLIGLASDLDKTTDFGNIETGFMHTEALHALYEKLEKGR